jgi:uncharacterized protein (DUF2147 family)
MQPRFFVPVALLALAGAAGLPAKALAADPSGVWAKDDGSAKIEVSKCGRGLCSKIVWLRNPNDSRGKPLRDGRNEDVSLRTRPIMGLSLFSRMAPAGPNVWVGSVYNPEEGKIYNDVKITLVSSRQIVLRGCKAMLFCGEKTWTRTSAPTPPPAATPPASEQPALIEAKGEEPKAVDEKVEAAPTQSMANAASVPNVEQHAPQAFIAPGVVTTATKADRLPLSGEDVPRMMIMNKPAQVTGAAAPATAPAMANTAADTAPPMPVERAKLQAKPQTAEVKSAGAPAQSRVATRETAPAADPEAKPQVKVVQEPHERLPWERPRGYTPSYVGFDEAAPPPRRGLFGRIR